MGMPLVSAIMPVCNGERYVLTALKSIIGQDYRPIEVIVVDDGSTDRSAEIVKSCEEVRYIYQENQGVAVARNAGIAASRGEFVSFLDQDDLWVPDKLSIQVDHLIKNPAIGYVIAEQHIFLEDGCGLPAWAKMNDYLDKDHAGFLPGTLVVRRQVFEQIGFFDTAYVTSSDSAWFFRAKDAGILMTMLPNVLLRKRVHGQNQSSETKTANDELLRIARASIMQQRRKNPGEVLL